MTKKCLLSFCFLLSFCTSVFCVSYSEKSWRILEQAQVCFDSGNYGDAFKFAREAFVSRKNEAENEFNVLARSIYTSISDDHVDVDAVVPYTIILGDYNLNLRESGITTANVPGVLIVDSQKRIVPTNEVGMRDGTYIIKTQQADLSTMNKDADNYVSNYDHFSFDTRTEQNIVRGRPHRLSVAEEMSSYKEYRDTVSDHIPIMLEIDLK